MLNLICKLKSQSLKEEWRYTKYKWVEVFSVTFPQSVIICGAMHSAGVGPLHFIKPNVSTDVQQKILEHFMPPLY